MQQKPCSIVALLAVCAMAAGALSGPAAGQGLSGPGSSGLVPADGFPWPYTPGNQAVVSGPPAPPIVASRPASWPGIPAVGGLPGAQADDPPPYFPGQQVGYPAPEGGSRQPPQSLGVVRQLPPPPRGTAEIPRAQIPNPVATQYAQTPYAAEAPRLQTSGGLEVPQAGLSPRQEPPDPAEMEPCEGAQILARVGSEVILASEVLPAVNEVLARYESQIPAYQLEQQRQLLIQQQLKVPIETKLIYLDVRRAIPAENLPRIEQKLGAEFDNNELRKLMDSAKVQTREELDLKLRKLGTSVARRRQAFIQRALAQSWLHQQLNVDVEIGYDEMLEYYREHLADFERPARARWEELAVQISRYPSKAEAEQAIARMGNQVRAGAAFAEVARAMSDGPTASDGGTRNWTHKGSLVCEELDRALFGLPVGQLSPIIESADGLHIIRVIERDPGGRVPFVEAQAEIRPKLRQQQASERLQTYIAGLRQEIPVWTVFDQQGEDEEISGREGNPRR